MEPPPGDLIGGESTAGETTRSIPTPFLTKAYQLVDDPAINDIISWNEDGSAFVVRNPTEFARDLLPKYFKHNNFSSFVRQLNTYGFRKVVSDRWEFSNESFRRGEKRLLCEIHRRKVGTPAAAAQASPAATVVAVQDHIPVRTVSPSEDSGEEQVVSSTSSPSAVREAAAGPGGSTAELIGENERLRKENMQLNEELSHMKSLCRNIYSLMSGYANCNTSCNSSNQSPSPDVHSLVPKALNLLPPGRWSSIEAAEETSAGGGAAEDNCMEIGEMSPKLFGFAIGVKRPREKGG